MQLPSGLDARSYGARAHSTWRALRCLTIALAAATAPAAAQQPGADGPSKALEGRWRLELYLDTPSARTEPMAGQINGEIAFSNTAWWNPRDRFGRHNLDLQSFFGRSFLRPANVTAFGPGDTSMVTEISGNVRGDSVNIDFIPRIDHGGISMWGRFFGDSAKGRWDRRGTDGEGHFVLRRISKDPVNVAAIPDGRPAPVAVAAAPPPKPLTKAQLRAQARAEAIAKAKAADSARVVARAATLAKAKADALARQQARDSAKAQAVALAQAKKDSAAAIRVAARTVPNAASAPPAATTSAPGVTNAAPDAVAGPPNAAATRAAPAASLAAAAPASTSAAAPATSAPATSTAPGAAPLRVRIYDIASNNYFPTKYSLHLPDGHWLYGTLRTGANPDGWGPAVVRPPGKYEVEITDFMCGDKIWFLKNKILKPVVIEPGKPTDVTIDVNVPAEPARPSLENTTGASCTQPPGGKP
ncbi:MAG: hypothetical protein ACJ79K_13375 [Gemmatimonadaceae bacterium]